MTTIRRIPFLALLVTLVPFHAPAVSAAPATGSGITVPLDRETMDLIQQLEPARREKALLAWQRMTPSERERFKKDLATWSKGTSALQSAVSGGALGGFAGSLGVLGRALLFKVPPTPASLAVLGGALAVGAVGGLVHHYTRGRKKADDVFTAKLDGYAEQAGGRDEGGSDMDLETSDVLEKLEAGQKELVLRLWSRAGSEERERISKALADYSRDSSLWPKLKNGGLVGTAGGLLGGIGVLLPKALAGASLTTGLMAATGGLAAAGLAAGVAGGYLWNRYVSGPRARRALERELGAVEEALAGRTAGEEPAATGPETPGAGTAAEPTGEPAAPTIEPPPVTPPPPARRPVAPAPAPAEDPGDAMADLPLTEAP